MSRLAHLSRWFAENKTHGCLIRLVVSEEDECSAADSPGWPGLARPGPTHLGDIDVCRFALLFPVHLFNKSDDIGITLSKKPNRSGLGVGLILVLLTQAKGASISPGPQIGGAKSVSAHGVQKPLAARFWREHLKARLWAAVSSHACHLQLPLFFTHPDASGRLGRK